MHTPRLVYDVTLLGGGGGGEDRIFHRSIHPYGNQAAGKCVTAAFTPQLAGAGGGRSFIFMRQKERKTERERDGRLRPLGGYCGWIDDEARRARSSTHAGGRRSAQTKAGKTIERVREVSIKHTVHPPRHFSNRAKVKASEWIHSCM